MQKLLRTTALVAVLAGLTISPALSLAGEFVVEEYVFDYYIEFEEEFEVTEEAETDGLEDAEGGEGSEDYDESDPAGLADAVVLDFSEAISFCDAIGADEYVIDCLSERMSVIAEQLPETGEFAEMRATIAQASSDLGALAAQNRSATLPSGVARSAEVATTRPLRPVATETLAASLQAAEAIVAQAEVVLLRSSSNSDNRALEFQRVAAIVGSTRSLLRSA